MAFGATGLRRLLRGGGRLRDEILGLRNVSVGELATRLGLAYSTVLSKAQETPLSPGLREKVLALKREHLAARAAKP
jgi:hypothetical protein